jgi:hypothetical protein
MVNDESVIRALVQAAVYEQDAALQKMRPSVLYKPALECKGEGSSTLWTMRYGELAARGNSPAEAAQAFDVMWRVGRML